MAIKQRPGADRSTQARVHDEISKPRAADARRLSVPVDPAMYRQMQRIAFEQDRPLAEITRELWAQYIEEQGYGE